MNTQQQSGAQKTGWGAAIIAGMASYLDGAITVGTGTALVIFQTDLGISGDQIGQLSALLVFFFAIGAVVGGRLGDRFGRRRVFTATMVLILLGALIMIASPTVALFYVAVILMGAGAGADLPVSLAMIAENAPEGKAGRMVTFSQYLWLAGILATIFLGIGVGGLGALGGRIFIGHVALVTLIVLLLRLGLPESRAWVRTRTEAIRVAAETGEPAPRFGLGRLLRSEYRIPLIATTLFYALVMVGLSVTGFSSYLYVNIAGSDVQTSSMVGLGVMLTTFIGTTLMLKIVDTRLRRAAFIVAAVINVAAYAIPAVAGVSVPTLVLMGVCSALGGAVAGEPMYKVWSQELFPTQFRATAQGASMFVARVVAALIALVTPALLSANVVAFFATMAATTLAAVLIGIFWIFRIPKARDADLTRETAAEVPA